MRQDADFEFADAAETALRGGRAAAGTAHGAAVSVVIAGREGALHVARVEMEAEPLAVMRAVEVVLPAVEPEIRRGGLRRRLRGQDDPAVPRFDAHLAHGADDVRSQHGLRQPLFAVVRNGGGDEERGVQDEQFADAQRVRHADPDVGGGHARNGYRVGDDAHAEPSGGPKGEEVAAAASRVEYEGFGAAVRFRFDEQVFAAAYFAELRVNRGLRRRPPERRRRPCSEGRHPAVECFERTPRFGGAVRELPDQGADRPGGARIVVERPKVVDGEAPHAEQGFRSQLLRIFVQTGDGFVASGETTSVMGRERIREKCERRWQRVPQGGKHFLQRQAVAGVEECRDLPCGFRRGRRGFRFGRRRSGADEQQSQTDEEVFHGSDVSVQDQFR